MITINKQQELYSLYKLKKDNHVIYDYYDNNIYIGRFILETINDYHLLWKVKIFDEYQGKGYGKKMMQEILDTFKKDFYLYVRADNTIAIKLYERFGFVVNTDKIKNVIRPVKYLGLIKYKLKLV